MSVHALHSNAKTSRYLPFETDEDCASEELYSGERICLPTAGGDGNALLRAYVFIFFALGCGWAVFGGHAPWQRWLSAATAAFGPSSNETATGSLDLAASAPTPHVATADAEPAQPAAPNPQPTLQPLVKHDVAEAPALAAQTAAPPSTTAPDVADTSKHPPVSDSADPYKTRAAIVGLNPDLSRALLARLTPTDYRNAGIAIRTAVAKTPDTAVFVWPHQRKPELALFQVHFVRGAAPDCRRYVVTVTKDGWSTTAPPMEKCGSGALRQNTNGASAG